MARRLTHLNGIRAFEAAARHMSFAKAAEELGVTPAAVSQQIKSLEDYLGVVLFKRTKRALFLSETAQAVLPAAREGFDLLASVLTRARAARARDQLVVSVTPSWAAAWVRWTGAAWRSSASCTTGARKPRRSRTAPPRRSCAMT